MDHNNQRSNKRFGNEVLSFYLWSYKVKYSTGQKNIGRFGKV